MAKKKESSVKNTKAVLDFLSKKKKPSNPNTHSEEAPKKVTQWSEYRNIHSWRMVPIHEKSLEMLADDLMKWVNLPDSYRLTDFFYDRGMNKKTFYSLMEKCEKIQDAHEYAMAKIASRREIGALTKKLDPTAVFRSLAYYDPIEKEMMELRASIAAKFKSEIESNEPKIVVIERMPSSKLVPEKKK